MMRLFFINIKKKLGPNGWAIRAIFRGTMLLMKFHFLPEKLCEEATKAHHPSPVEGRLPNKNNRILRSNNPLDDFSLHSGQEKTLHKIPQAHIFFRGSSYNSSLLETVEGSVFLINWSEKIKRSDVYYATGDQGDALKFAQKKMFPILYARYEQLDSNGQPIQIPLDPALENLFKDDKNILIRVGFKHNNAMPDAGSSLGIISAIAHFANKLDIYGWDHYLSASPNNLGYVRRLLKLLFNSPNYKLFPYSNIIRSIYNFHYGYRFHGHPDIINHGYTSCSSSIETRAGKLIATRFDKIFYK